MPDKDRPDEGQRPGPEDQPRFEGDPSQLMSPAAFARWMQYTTSPAFLNEERIELLRRMSENLSREPALLEIIERMLADYSEEFRRVSPSQAELEQYGFSWTDTDGDQALIAPVAAAAALAPPAAALAAAHAPSD